MFSSTNSQKVNTNETAYFVLQNSHHVWIDHRDLSDSDDGLLDFTLGSDYLNVTWRRHPRLVDGSEVLYANNVVYNYGTIASGHKPPTMGLVFNKSGSIFTYLILSRRQVYTT